MRRPFDFDIVYSIEKFLKVGEFTMLFAGSLVCEHFNKSATAFALIGTCVLVTWPRSFSLNCDV